MFKRCGSGRSLTAVLLVCDLNKQGPSTLWRRDKINTINTVSLHDRRRLGDAYKDSVEKESGEKKKNVHGRITSAEH